MAKAVAPPLIRVGSRVKIDLDRVKDRIPSSLSKLLTSDPRGTVIGYRMTDGGGIGLVLKLSNGSTNWFFNEELTQS